MIHLKIIYQSTTYRVSEWCVFKDTKQRIIGTWEVVNE